ncbi:MAG: Ku protein [Nocardioides sp.]
MRAIWKGAISFGLVNVPVKVYSATESHDIALHQVHAADGGRIRYQRTCEVCGETVQYADIDKAYEDGAQRVVLTDADLDLLPAEHDREIEVLQFVPANQVDVLRLDKPYYLEPESQALKPYRLLIEALEDTDRTAIVRFTLRQRTRLAALRVRGDVLLLQTLLWDDEVRVPSFDILDQAPKITDKERKMAGQLVDQLAEDFDPAAYTDQYQEQLRALVEAKLEKGDSISLADFGGEPSQTGGGEVVDLMEALKRSVEAKKTGPSAKAEPAEDTGAEKPKKTKKRA